MHLLHHMKYYCNALIVINIFIQVFINSFSLQNLRIENDGPSVFMSIWPTKNERSLRKMQLPSRAFWSRNTYIWRNNQHASLQSENWLIATSAGENEKRLETIFQQFGDGTTGCNTLQWTDLNSRARSLHQLLDKEFHHGKAAGKAGYPSATASQSSHPLSIQGTASVCLSGALL